MITKSRLIIVVLLQVLALLAMVGMKQWTLNTGAPIALETAPLDPRSLFSGDYVRLNYKISQLRLDDLGGDRDFKAHEAVYVLLKKGEPYWQPVSVHHAMPALPPDHVAMKGVIQYVGGDLWNQQLRKFEKATYLNMRYGVENYYVPEGKGRELERPKPGEVVSIRLAVDRFGNAGIKAVLVNGQERYVESLF
jgi:uncharacterized membrane-anchored protein